MKGEIDVKQLAAAYTLENLNRISGQILQCYNARQYNRLRALLAKIGEPVNEKGGDRQLLSKLMMLYHPDKLSHYLQIIQAGNQNALASISHILITLEADELFGGYSPASGSFSSSVDLDDEEYAWDEVDETGNLREFDDDMEYDFYYGEDDNSFYSVMKKSLYGRQNIMLPHQLLEDIDELELSGRGMDSLEGIEHCIHLVTLDLSDNRLTNLEGMEGLAYLEELYLAGNNIGYIDTLSYLNRLRILDLSGNQVDDISPLGELTSLEFINLSGNPISPAQIEILKQKGCVVVY